MFSKIAQYAIKNILRNAFLSISSLLVLTLLMFFINILLIVQSISFQLIDSINSKLTISLYLNEKYDKTSVEVIDFMQDLKNFSPTINIWYKTKWELLEEIRKQDTELVKILERTNPLPDTIRLSNIKLDEYKLLNSVIESKLFLLSEESGVKDYFSNYTAQYQRIEKITTVLTNLQYGLYIIICIFIISIAVIVYSVIGNFVYYYKDEIYITRLVWGSSIFVYGPFIMQGIIYSIVSLILSTLFFYISIPNISFLLTSQYSLTFIFDPLIIFFLQLFVFCLIGGVSWFFSSRKYLTLWK
jgi:cell division transport system permease protein